MIGSVVRTCWWLLLLGFVTAAAVTAIYCCYWAVSESLAQRWTTAGAVLSLAVMLGAGTWLVYRHRTDLLYG